MVNKFNRSNSIDQTTKLNFPPVTSTFMEPSRTLMTAAAAAVTPSGSSLHLSRSTSACALCLDPSGSAWICLDLWALCLDLPGSMGNLYEGADVTWVTLVVLSTPSAQSQITRDPACRSLYMADATQGAGIYKDLHGVYMHAGHEDIKSGVIQSGHLECQIYNILGFDISQEISCANLISKARSRS